jgi:hypothetical protein
MILTDVRDYLKQHGQAPLRDMALVFGMEQDTLRPLIEQWIAKGKVTKLPQGTACGGGCSSCAPQDIEIYQWVNSSN